MRTGNRPVIAMPVMGTSLLRRYIQWTYISALHRAGADVRVLGESAEPVALKKAMRRCDGLLLPGGADISPGCYGQKPKPECKKANVRRDRVEMVLADIVLGTGKPVLGICRGMQMINVVCGGTLCQDITADQKFKHMDFRNRHRFTHPVTLEKDSLLHELFPTEVILVNSLHHQAVDRVGEGLKVIATSADGFVEGLQLENHPFCAGIQWHPEQMAAKNCYQQAIFDRFVRTAERKGRYK